MIGTYRGRTFHRLVDRDTGATYEGGRFEDCTFSWCGFSRTRDVSRRATARNIALVNCSVDNVALGPGIFEDVTIDRLRARALVQVWGAAYRHVSFRGRVGRIMLSPLVDPLQATEAQQRAFEEANRQYYASVDWALDVTEAEFSEFEAPGVPGHLIRRDPRDTALVTRERAQAGRWRQLDLSGTWWRTSLTELANSIYPSDVLVAPRRHRDYRRLADTLKLLKDEGIAEPD